jgi:hypothetical protein
VDIQQKLREEERQLGKEEARRRQDERVRNDPILGPFLRRLEERVKRIALELPGTAKDGNESAD